MGKTRKAASKKGRAATIKPLRHPGREPAKRRAPTGAEVKKAAAEGAIWVPKKIIDPVTKRTRIIHIKTTPERAETAGNIKTSRINDMLLAQQGRQTKDAQDVVASGANLSPWLYGGLPGRHRRVFGTPEGKQYVAELEKRVKANAAKGETTRLLDIGAGLAQHWRPVLNRLRKHGEVELHVLNPSQLGREHSPATEWYSGAIEMHDFGRGRYDGVLCTYGGFDKSNHPEETLQKMVRVTKKGGVQYLIFGRKELGEGKPVSRATMTTAIKKADPSARVTTWREPTGPRKHTQRAYRKDLMFVR